MTDVSKQIRLCSGSGLHAQNSQVHLDMLTLLVSRHNKAKTLPMEHVKGRKLTEKNENNTKFAKSHSHVSAQFCRIVLGWYRYFETAQVLFSLCFREKGVKTLKIYE